MNLVITSLKGVEYEGDIKSLNIKTTSGEITVLNNHLPLVTVLQKCTAHIVDEKGMVRDIDVRGGFLEVSPSNAISVLVD